MLPKSIAYFSDRPFFISFFIFKVITQPYKIIIIRFFRIVNRKYQKNKFFSYF
nr:MAG TPA: hypothetical protein [Bacteriophage sp.]